MSSAHNTTNAHAHAHSHPTVVEPTKLTQHTHATHNNDDVQPYPVVQESSQYTHDNTHNNNKPHPHPAVQPIEVSQYTYDATHKPSDLAFTHDQTLRQHSVASPPQPVASRIHPVETEHPHPHFEDHEKHDPKKHDKHDSVTHDKHDKHDEHHPEHPKPHHQSEPEHDKHPESKHHPEPHHKPEHTHAHEHNHSPTSPTSTLPSDSVQEPSPSVFGNAERRQSWSKDEMKRGVMEGLLEKGKGKQAKGGYSSTS